MRGAPIRHLSVSKIEKALLCGLEFKYDYIDKIPQLTGGKMVAGNVVHEILEHALKEFARTEKYPDAKTLDDMWSEVWEAKIKEEEEKEAFLGWQWDEGDPEERVKREYRPLVALARNEVLPTLRPWMIGTEPVVEHRFDLELQSAEGPFKLLGYIDLLEESGVLADWKTTDGKVSDRAKRTWMQFAAYSLYVQPFVGRDYVNCEKIFLVRGSRPKVERVPFSMGPAHREWFTRVAQQVWGMVIHDVYLPNTEGWKCSPKYCQRWHGCQGPIAMAKNGKG